MKRDDTEAGLIARIEKLRLRQERAEAEEVECLRVGQLTAANANCRKATQALFNRRKLQKQLDDMRARVS